jgi:hypothetical protein
MHTYMQGIYRKSSGHLQLWTVCNSPECGMYMLGGFRDGAMSGHRDPDSLLTGPGAPGGAANKTGRGDGMGFYGFMGGDGRMQGAGSGSAGGYRGSPTAVSSRAGAQRCLFQMKLQVHLPEDEQLLDGADGGEADRQVDGSGEEMGEEGGEMARAAHQISLSGNITSNNCGFSLHVNATAMNFEVYYTKAMHYTLMVTAASFLQVLLLVRQIDYSNSRVRFFQT